MKTASILKTEALGTGLQKVTYEDGSVFYMQNGVICSKPSEH